MRSSSIEPATKLRAEAEAAVTDAILLLLAFLILQMNECKAKLQVQGNGCYIGILRLCALVIEDKSVFKCLGVYEYLILMYGQLDRV